jgi:hypothetical protein
VPEFADLNASGRARIVKLIVEGSTLRAREELKSCTGAPERFAKIWGSPFGKGSAAFSGTSLSALWQTAGNHTGEAMPSLPCGLALSHMRSLANFGLQQTPPSLTLGRRSWNLLR